MTRATVEYKPEEPGEMVTMHACWVADNGYETAVFPTKEEAIAFCRRRWKLEPTVTEPAALAVETEDWVDLLIKRWEIDLTCVKEPFANRQLQECLDELRRASGKEHR